MLVPRQQYSRELKVATMREIDSGKTMAEVARMYQISPNRLLAWKASGARRRAGFPWYRHPSTPTGDAELIAQLERKIGR